jgi:hypothetical protein
MVPARRTALPLIALQIVCAAVVSTNGLKSRDDAFIGYSEGAKCSDQQRWAREPVPGLGVQTT